jgi:hypothetical protein
MVLVGVSFEDNTNGGYDLWAIDLKGDVDGNDGDNVAKIGNFTPADPDADFEGLATNPATGAVFAITESNVSRNALFKVFPDKFGYKLDQGRVGDDAGLDFAANSKGADVGAVLYNIQGEDEGAGIGSQLYKIVIGTKVNSEGNTVKFGDVSKVGGFQAGKFLDGLAIDSELFNGEYGVASDFENSEGDGDELWKIDLSTGAQTLLGGVKFTDFAGNAIGEFNSDSGLAYDATTDKLYAIEDETNDLFFTTKTDVTNGGSVTFQEINDDLPNPGGGDVNEGEFEGLAIANVNFSFVNENSSLFSSEAGQDVLAAGLATILDPGAISSI